MLSGRDSLLTLNRGRCRALPRQHSKLHYLASYRHSTLGKCTHTSTDTSTGIDEVILPQGDATGMMHVRV